MIVRIDSSLSEALADPKNSNVLNAIEDLCRLRVDGFVIVDVSKKIANQFKESERLGELQRKVFSLIATEVTFQIDVLEKFKKRIVLFHGEISDEIEDEDKVLSIDVSKYSVTLSNKTRLTRPHLVLENHTDSVVYKKIASWVTTQDAVPSCFHINFHTIHGGGDTTADVCKHHYSEGSIVFSLCDSDRKSPYCSVGNTAKKIQKFFDEIELQLCFHLINAHEVENLIPISILENVANTSQKPTINFLKHVDKQFPDGYLYYDMKNGFSYQFVYISQEHRSAYWREIYEAYGSAELEQKKSDLASDPKSHNNTLFCRLSSMLPHARTRFSEEDVKVIEQSSLEAEWQKIGNWMIGLFIAYAPIRV